MQTCQTCLWWLNDHWIYMQTHVSEILWMKSSIHWCKNIFTNWYATHKYLKYYTLHIATFAKHLEKKIRMLSANTCLQVWRHFVNMTQRHVMMLRDSQKTDQIPVWSKLLRGSHRSPADTNEILAACQKTWK